MKVHEIFRSIQGEGKLAGTPMTFIRLYGCNLSCPWCDTPQNSYKEIPIKEVIGKVEDNWACITGGEPAVQYPELLELAAQLRGKGYKVALETNGTYVLSRMDFDWICISPKDIQPPFESLWNAHEIKVLVGSGMYTLDEAIRYGYFSNISKVSLLPIWDENYENNLARAIELCQKYQVRLTVQIHKYLAVK